MLTEMEQLLKLLWSVRWNKRLLLGNNNLLFRLTDHNNDLLFHLSDFLESIQLKNTIIMKNCNNFMYVSTK